MQIIQGFFFIHIGHIAFVNPVRNISAAFSEHRRNYIKVNIRTLTYIHGNEEVAPQGFQLGKYRAVAVLAIVIEHGDRVSHRARQVT